MPPFDHTPFLKALESFRSGQMVIVSDDDTRENEGDIVLSAAHAQPEQIAFMIRHTSGILCAPLTVERGEKLKLPLMTEVNNAPLETAFTVSVDVEKNLTTGISAKERCQTINRLAHSEALAEDFVRPGHIFPLLARKGGVLIRSGHTEAAVDLCKLSGHPEVAVIAEIMNDDGTLKRGQELKAFAKEHALMHITVAQIIAWRQCFEQLIERVEDFSLRTPIGLARVYRYKTPYDKILHIALVFGDISEKSPVCVRLQTESVAEDVFAQERFIDRVLARIQAEGAGVIIYFREGALGIRMPDMPQLSQVSSPKQEENWYEIGVGAQILKDLGVTEIMLLASCNRHYVGLNGFGIDLVETCIL